MNDKAPVISVLVPVWGSMPYVIKAVESILNQSFRDFELLIVDDKGPDDSIAQLQKYTSDPRVRILDNGVNRGFSGAMNHGLEVARGEFIAALDADDIALPNRLEAQLAYLRAHPEVGILGTAAVHITPDDTLLEPHRQPISDHAVRFQQLFMPAMYHSSTMLRRSLVEQHKARYTTTLSLASDMDFWSQLGRHAAFVNLPEPLIYYRINPNGLSKIKKDECTQQKLMVTEQALRDLGMMDEDILRMRSVITFYVNEDPVSSADVRKLRAGLEDTLTFYCKKQGLKRTPWILNATIGKWYIKTILYTPSSSYRLRELARFAVIRPCHAFAAFLHIAELLLWQARWKRKFRMHTL